MLLLHTASVSYGDWQRCCFGLHSACSLRRELRHVCCILLDIHAPCAHSSLGIWTACQTYMLPFMALKLYIETSGCDVCRAWRQLLEGPLLYAGEVVENCTQVNSGSAAPRLGSNVSELIRNCKCLQSTNPRFSKMLCIKCASVCQDSRQFYHPLQSVGPILCQMKGCSEAAYGTWCVA